MSTEEAAALTAVRQTWDERLQDHIAPVRLAIGVIRERKVRHRLNEAMNLLEVWDSGLAYAFHGRSRVWVLRGVVSHAVDCVGAWQREEALPEPNRAFREARESLEAKQAEWEPSTRPRRRIGASAAPNVPAGSRHRTGWRVGRESPEGSGKVHVAQGSRLRSGRPTATHRSRRGCCCLQFYGVSMKWSVEALGTRSAELCAGHRWNRFHRHRSDSVRSVHGINRPSPQDIR